MKSRVSGCCVLWVALGMATSAFGENTKSGVRIDLDETPAPVAKTPAPAAASKPQKPAVEPKATVDSKAAPGAKPAPKSAAKKDEPPPKIEGMEISRGERGYVGLSLQNNTFRMTFYGPDKKPVAPDVSSVALRWPVNYQKSDERTTLLPSSDGKALVSEKIVRPPFSFKLFITMLKDSATGAEVLPETYVVDFRG